MDSARKMIYRRGDVLKLQFPRLDPRRGPKKRYALVLSSDEYNRNNDHGVLVAISTGVLNEQETGVYQIGDWRGSGLDHESMVVPWLYTLEWSVVIEKAGELAPHEFRQALQRLRQVVEI